MARELPRIINVIDLETTCQRTEAEWPEGHKQDIIEVGIVELDMSPEVPQILSKTSYLVIPRRSKISEFCTELTTITAEMIEEQGIEFTDVLEILKKKYDSKERGWASWGDFDRNMFQRQCQDLNLKYPFGPRHQNLKFLFALMNRLSREPGMPKALEICGLPLEGTHHRGHDDAENIAKIAQIMFRKKQ